MTSTVTYTGDLRTLASHLQSGSTIETDAPTDNHGKGERFSPTDLIGTSLAACIVTTMAIRAKQLEGKLKGVVTQTEKIMSAAPRRISGINITFHWPTENSYTEEERTILEDIAWTCPVKESIHPDIKLTIDFNWH
jgi:putative redox protein